MTRTAGAFPVAQAVESRGKSGGRLVDTFFLDDR
jgi:hypothetical protein